MKDAAKSTQSDQSHADSEQTYVVTIRRRLPSQNWSTYAHWTKYKKERDMWFVLMRQQLPPVQPVTRKIRMKIVSYRLRLVDFANLVGGAKPIPDNLIKLGYLKDDAPEWFECSYEQYTCPRADERTELHFYH